MSRPGKRILKRETRSNCSEGRERKREKERERARVGAAATSSTGMPSPAAPPGTPPRTTAPPAPPTPQPPRPDSVLPRAPAAATDLDPSDVGPSLRACTSTLRFLGPRDEQTALLPRRCCWAGVINITIIGNIEGERGNRGSKREALREWVGQTNAPFAWSLPARRLRAQARHCPHSSLPFALLPTELITPPTHLPLATFPLLTRLGLKQY